MSALSRIANAEHKKVEIIPGDRVIISASPIPGNEKYVSKLVDDLFKQGADVIYHSLAETHVSGHACQEELKLIQALVKPKFFIPVHGEYKHLRQHGKLAEEMGVQHLVYFTGSVMPEEIKDLGESEAYVNTLFYTDKFSLTVENLPKIKTIAEEVLSKAGVRCPVTVKLTKEAFDVRHYDSFSLPSGVYNSLRIILGEGAGHNWWCVSFPSLCMTDSRAEFDSVSADACMSDCLTGTLAGDSGYEVRFFLLDQLGKLENIFFRT